MGEDLSIVMSQLEIKSTPDQLDGSDTLVSILPNNTSRSLRKRSLSSCSTNSSEMSLHKTRNRKIQKPKKLEKLETDTQIKNFYININKKVKLKPNLLETIFEGEEEETSESNSSEVPASDQKSIGLRKIKRQIIINDGLNATKSLKEKRKNQIKKFLGSRRKKPKKIGTEKFMQYFNDLISSGNIVGQDASVPCKGECHCDPFFVWKNPFM
jgi:hypothetical protein